MIRILPKLLISRLIVPLTFPVVRILTDQMFLVRANLPNHRPLMIAAPLVFVMRAWSFIRRLYHEAFVDYALVRYSRFVKRHYGKNGRGYFSYEGLTDKEKVDLYGKPKGRIEPFLDTFGGILPIQDGDSFLDAGCGRGQNTKVLFERFQGSEIMAFDVSEGAISVIDAAVNDERLSTNVRDLVSPDTLSAIADNTYDHVVISHVFSILVGPGLEATRNLRRRIIQELARVARKSLIVVDSEAIIAPGETFVIEQLDRGWFCGPIQPYFDNLPGNVIALSAGGSYAVVFLPNRETET